MRFCSFLNFILKYVAIVPGFSVFTLILFQTKLPPATDSSPTIFTAEVLLLTYNSIPPINHSCFNNHNGAYMKNVSLLQESDGQE